MDPKNSVRQDCPAPSPSSTSAKASASSGASSLAAEAAQPQSARLFWTLWLVAGAAAFCLVHFPSEALVAEIFRLVFAEAADAKDDHLRLLAISNAPSRALWSAQLFLWSALAWNASFLRSHGFLHPEPLSPATAAPDSPLAAESVGSSPPASPDIGRAPTPFLEAPRAPSPGGSEVHHDASPCHPDAMAWTLRFASVALLLAGLLSVRSLAVDLLEFVWRLT